MDEQEHLETKIMNSFRLAKSDIIKLQERFMEIRNSQARVIERLERLENENMKQRQLIQPVTIMRRESVAPKPKTITKTRTITKFKVIRAKAKTASQTYVASKNGKKFHDPGCVSLKKVPSNKWVVYTSKKKAMAKGLKPCGICIPR